MRISDWSSDVCSSDLQALAVEVVDQPAARRLAFHKTQKLAALRGRHMVTDEARQDDVPPLSHEVAIITGDEPHPLAKPRPRDRRALRVEVGPGEIERDAAAFAPARDPR